MHNLIYLYICSRLMSDISYFIDTDFSEYDCEVFSKDQISDAFVSAVRSIAYDDDGVTVCLGASEPVDGFLVISAIVYSDRCTLELYKDADDKEPEKSKEVSIEDAVKAFKKFYDGEIPKFSKYDETKPAFIIETNFTDYSIPERSKKQIEELITMLPEVGDEDIICDEDCYEDGAYVVLIAPEAIKGVEYVQAMFDEDEGWYVEISFTDRKKRVNFAELFSVESEVIRIFNEFYDGNIPDIDDWTKVKI